MEEVPLYSPEIEPPEEHAPDPERLGDLLLRRYEVSPSEPLDGTRRAEKQAAKRLIKRGKAALRATPEKRPKSTVAETVVELEPPSQEVAEAEFDRRKETITQNTSWLGDAALKDAAAASTPDAPAKTPSATSPLGAPPSPPPIIPTTPSSSLADSPSAQPIGYKKPLVIGLLAGTATAIVLIIVYFTK